MKKLRGIGTAGLTLVELIISMAILAVVGIAVGGAMYVSSRSYTRGASEVNVQEEAQVASNLICDWIIDATSVNPDLTADPTGKTFLDGEFDYLEIIHPDGDRLVHVRVEQSGSDLIYTAKDITNPSDPHYGEEVSGVLASNVTGCYFYTTFGTDRNVKISLDFNVNERTYRAVTDSTSRSHDFISTGGTSTVNAPVIRFGLVSNAGGPHVTLEPGQRSDSSQYTFDVFVDNCDVSTLTGAGLTYTAPASATTQIVSCNRVGETNQWKVTVRSNDSATGPDNYIFSASNTAGTGTKTLQVRIRRVQDCSYVNVETRNGKDYIVKTSGTDGAANSTYDSEINLNAVNWEQELDIQGSRSGVMGEEGFDASPWGYYDPTQLQVKFVSFNSSTNRWVDRSSDVNYQWIDGANPTLHIVLTRNIDSAIAVVVVADHSGSINGNTTSQSDPYCGVSVSARNRAAAMDGRTTFGYGPGGKAFYDVAWIPSGGGYDPWNNVGTGFRRGTPACMTALFNSDTETRITQLVARAYPGVDPNRIASGGFTYKTVLYYRPQYIVQGGVKVRNLTGAYQTIFMYSDSNLNAMMHEASRRLRYDVASIFKLDTSYDIYLEFQCWNGTELKDELRFNSGSGEVPAATPYVYNPGTGKFRLTDSTSTQITLNRSDRQQVSLYMEGCCFNGNDQWYHGNDKPYIDCYVEQLIDGHWQRVDNAVVDKAWTEGSDRCPTHTITFDDPTDTRSFPVGGYQENEYGYKNQNLELVFVNTSGFTPGGNYRLKFDTYYMEVQNINGVTGQVSNPQNVHYILDNYVYFTVR